MSPATKLAGFAAALGLLFAGGAAAGGAIDPDRSGDAASAHAARETHGETQPTHGGGMKAEHESGDSAQDEHPVRGLAVAERGLRIVVEDAELRRDVQQPLRFRIVDRQDRTARDFDVEHTKRMHLILARRDLTGFQHLHPVQQADGSWSTSVRLRNPGSYRVFADFTRQKQPYTLATDLRVDGPADLRALPAPRPVAKSDGGLEVSLTAKAVRAGDESELRFLVREDGRTVHTEPYLGAGGHLVALREGDLAFLHVHPTDHGDSGERHDDAVGFAATFPTQGRYRLFLQFKHEGRVHTVAFTQEVR